MSHQLLISLRLYFRNTMALVYGYLFPTIFLVAFWVLYRYDRVPLARHMGELLTISVLGGACFGLPTTMVSERERGVWRRYRLAPVRIGSLVASTVLARYLILITAGALQLALAMGIGMPLPRHPLGLLLAFSFVAFAFLGLGLVIATLADNVPAVQALGQCLFLPMLIIGGIAVPLASLPEWAQHVSAFFPGRYAVEAIQASVTGSGLGPVRFSLLALLVIGAAGCVAGAKMFRWDAQQRFVTRGGRGWLAVAVMAWVAVGLMAESRGRIAMVLPVDAADESAAGAVIQAPGRPASPESGTVVPAPAPMTGASAGTSGTIAQAPSVAPARSAPDVPPSGARGAAPMTSPPATPPGARGVPVPTTAGAQAWQAVTMADIDRDLIFTRLPSDGGVVTPIASADEPPPDADVADQLEHIRVTLPEWKPGKAQDLVQRVRNYLYIAAVPDIFQLPLERYVPLVVFDRLQQDIAKDDLIKILYWIALHPGEGDDSAVDELRPLGLGNGPGDADQLRERTAVYAVKLLGRLTGRRPAKLPPSAIG